MRHEITHDFINLPGGYFCVNSKDGLIAYLAIDCRADNFLKHFTRCPWPLIYSAIKDTKT